MTETASTLTGKSCTTQYSRPARLHGGSNHLTRRVGVPYKPHQFIESIRYHRPSLGSLSSVFLGHFFGQHQRVLLLRARNGCRAIACWDTRRVDKMAVKIRGSFATESSPAGREPGRKPWGMRQHAPAGCATIFRIRRHHFDRQPCGEMGDAVQDPAQSGAMGSKQLVKRQLDTGKMAEYPLYRGRKYTPSLATALLLPGTLTVIVLVLTLKLH